MFGDQIISENENVTYFALENYLNASKEDWSRCQESLQNIINYKQKSNEGIAYEAFGAIWDWIVDFFKDLIRFIMNLGRSQIFKIKAQAIYKKMINLYKTGVTSELDWNVKVSIPKSIYVNTDKINELVGSIETEDDKDIVAYNVHKNKTASATLNTLTEIKKYSTDDMEEIPVGEALRIISENDKGAKPIAIGNLKDVETYIKTYANYSASRLRALMAVNNKAQRKLKRSIRHKESKLEDESVIENYRLSVQICDTCTKTLVKNINFAFKCTNVLLDSYKPKHNKNN